MVALELGSAFRLRSRTVRFRHLHDHQRSYWSSSPRLRSGLPWLLREALPERYELLTVHRYFDAPIRVGTSFSAPRAADFDTVSISEFAAQNWKLIRNACAMDAANRSVALADFVSCALLGRATSGDDTCLWCSHFGD